MRQTIDPGEMEARNESLRLQITMVLVKFFIILAVVAIIVSVDIFLGDLAALIALFVSVLIGIFVLMESRDKAQADRMMNVHRETIRGYVDAQAADDRGEIMRMAASMFRSNTSLENRAASMARIIGAANETKSLPEPKADDKKAQDGWNFDFLDFPDLEEREESGW